MAGGLAGASWTSGYLRDGGTIPSGTVRTRMPSNAAVAGVIFDLGSTLIHRTGLELEREKCAALAAFAAAELGCADPEALAARLLEVRLEAWRRAEAEQVEQLATRSIADALAAAGLRADDATLRRAEAAFFEPEVRASRLYPGARQVLEALAGRGLRLAMISNATSHQLVLDITRRHGIEGFFDPLMSSAGFGRTKPHPTIFRHVLQAWGLRPAAAVMVGDSLGADVLGAQRVGMRSILVDIEPHPDNARFTGTARPSARVTDLREIPDLVRRWNGGA
jgi:HAD superfamily hydrolase (TIGR01509 family)